MDIKLPIRGTVIGIGTDIVEVERIRRVYTKHPERFLNRVFTKDEQDYCMGMKNPFPHLAARFAAKEAVSKAFTTGIGSELKWTSMSVFHGSRHEPHIKLDEKGTRLLEKLGGTGVLITLSHTAQYAQAVALLLENNGKTQV